MKSPLISMIYCSKAAPELAQDATVLADILETAAANNQKLGITGAMTVADGYVLQCLEGERSAVNELYATILQDPRHERCEILDYRVVGQRLYAQWGMAGVPAAFVHESGLLASGRFDPFRFGPDDAFQFIVAASDPEILAAS